MLLSGIGTVTAPDQVEEILAEFDVVGNVMDALGAVGFFHNGASILIKT